MSLSSSTAQSRELGELRNHLKWLDEERRKSARKMAELEQRIAQQGRELAERDHKIQELESHVAGIVATLEEPAEMDSSVATQEQRIHDLEWQLSNVAAQFAHLPSAEAERALWQTGIAELRNEVVTTRAMLDITKDDVEAAKAEVIATKAEVDATSAKVDATKAEVDATSAKVDATIAEVVATRAEVDAAKADVIAIKQEVDTTRAEVDATRAEVDSAKADVIVIKQEVDTTRAEVEDTKAEVAATKEVVDATRSEIETTRAEIEVTRSDVGEARAGVEATKAEMDIARTTLSVSIAELQEQVAIGLTAATDRTPTVPAEFAGFSARLEELEVAQAATDDRLLTELRGLLDSEERLRQDLDALTVQIQHQIATLTEQDQEISAELLIHAPRLDELAASLARVEDTVTRLGNVRELMALLSQIDQEMELRQAEEVRLAGLIATQDTRFSPLVGQLEGLTDTLTALSDRVAESEQIMGGLGASLQELDETWKPLVTETNRRLTPMGERLNSFTNSMMKVETGLQTLTAEQAEARELIDDLADNLRRQESDTARQLSTWQISLDEQKETIERFTQQWVTLSGQYKEARMAVQNFAHWQKQLEQQKREGAELVRVETGRMQARWEGFLNEIQERLRNFEVELGQRLQNYELDNEQKWAAARRAEQIWREEIRALDGLIQKLQQDNRNLIWRVQAAQADAIKKWPRLLMEEVEKAVEMNPERRLPSMAGTAASSELSVVDAIEQGLITISYSDEPVEDK